MKRFFLAIVVLTLMIPMGFGQLSDELYDLSKVRDNVKSKRVSSYDRTDRKSTRLNFSH